MHEGIPQFAELYPSCFRQPRQPLKIGIHNDIVARHPELRPSLIARALKTYTRSLGYLETLTAGAARIDLEGNPVGTVTAADEADAKRFGELAMCRPLTRNLEKVRNAHYIVRHSRHPELQPGLIASALRMYTRSVGYLETLKAG